MDIAKWRLVRSGAENGNFNMALDEAILESVGSGRVPPTLRLYRWEPPCLSLGYAQPMADADLPALQRSGWDLVRRPTGGRAILHTDELTYAVIAPATEPRVAGSVLESYRRLSAALLAALHHLGIPARADQEYAQAKTVAASAAVCFERPSNYEITVNDKKLIGSAQARRHEGVLQHGSLPLTGDLTRITRGLAFPDQATRQQAAARLLERAATVQSACGLNLTWDEAAAAFVWGFENALAIDFEESSPLPAEMDRARELLEQKYGNPQWTGRV